MSMKPQSVQKGGVQQKKTPNYEETGRFLLPIKTTLEEQSSVILTHPAEVVVWIHQDKGKDCTVTSQSGFEFVLAQ